MKLCDVLIFDQKVFFISFVFCIIFCAQCMDGQLLYSNCIEQLIVYGNYFIQKQTNNMGIYNLVNISINIRDMNAWIKTYIYVQCTYMQ